MAFLATLGMLALYASLLILVFGIAWGIYYDQTRIHIPPGIKYPARVRLYHAMITFGGLAANIAEKLGISHQYKFIAKVFLASPSKKSSTLTIKDLVFDDVPVRVYWPKTTPSGKRRGVVVIPGGGGILGNIGISDEPCRYIAEASDSVVVSIAFRLAPEYPFPIPVMDCCTATAYFLKNAAEYGVDPNRIAVYGECSGGTFAAAVCQYLAVRNDLPKLCAQALTYPYLQTVDFNLPSYQQNHSVPIMFKKRALKLGMLYLTGKRIDVEGLMKNAHLPEHVWMKYRKWVNPDYIPERFKGKGYVPLERPPCCQEVFETIKESLNPMFSPLLAEDDVIRQLPKTFLLTCEYDIFRDDGLLFKKRLEDNGVPVTWHYFEGGFHGIMIGMNNWLLEYPSLKIHFQHIIDFLSSL